VKAAARGESVICGDFSDFPVEINSCLWTAVEKLVLNRHCPAPFLSANFCILLNYALNSQNGTQRM